MLDAGDDQIALFRLRADRVGHRGTAACCQPRGPISQARLAVDLGALLWQKRAYSFSVGAQECPDSR
jgi:hypothetical protein